MSSPARTPGRTPANRGQRTPTRRPSAQDAETPMRMGARAVASDNVSLPPTSPGGVSVPPTSPARAAPINMSEIDLSSPLNYGTPSSMGSIRTPRSGIRGTPVRARPDIRTDKRMRQVAVNAPDSATCRFMSELREEQDICAFVTHTASCHEAENRINYLNFIFCVAIDYIDVSFTLATLMLLMVASILVLTLCALALNSMSNVLSIIKYFQMNEHNAGVTIMVLFNGIPDIISAFFFYDGDTEMLINEMLGTSLYLRAFHSGILILLFPATLLGTYFKRDAFAFLCGILVLFNMVSERDTNVLEGIFAMTFYPILCCVVCYHHHIARKERKGSDHKEVSEEIKIRLELTKEIEIIQMPVTSEANPVALNIWKQFLMVINPFRKETYDYASLWQKLLIFVAIPVKLLVPVVNLRMPGDGWSRLLLVGNFFLSPLIVVQFIGLQHTLACLSIGLLLAILVFCLTKTNIPQYQLSIALYGICCEMLITHFLAAELLSILVTLGNIIGVKRSVIGTTFLAWGNTIPEVVVYRELLNWKIKTLPLVEFLMAPLFSKPFTFLKDKQIQWCFFVFLLDMIFAIGLTTVLRCIDKKSFTVVTRAGDLGQSGLWFSFIHHILLTFAIFTVNFHLRKSIGIYSMFIYLIFVLYTCLYQFDFIHAFGSDHNDEEKFIAVS